ncbi:MAG: glycogen/starch synthase, partial [Smithellaceae bacterium]|nr:glycogen/starch synthase [Smithellaceae bacterium]
MKVLMFGWEFPPHMSGGLGTACFGITKAITGLGHEVVFVLPKIKDPIGSSHVELVSAADVPLVQRHLLEESFFRGMELKTVNSPLSPYLN